MSEIRTPDTPAVSVVIPARNEEGTLPITLPRILDAVAQLTVPAELIVVVPQESIFAERPPLVDPRTQWVTVDVPGKYAALRCGVARSRGGVVVFLDADVLPRPDTLSRLLDAVQRPGVNVAAGRIVVQARGGSVVHRALEYWTSVSVAAWHRLRHDRPDLRWALPGALYAFERHWFPAEGLLVGSLDDASIGLSMFEAGARIAYVPEAVILVGAARSPRQWLRQKLRIRRGWKRLKELRPGQVSDLQSTLSRNTADLCRGKVFAQALRAADRVMAVVAENSRTSSGDLYGVWLPDRTGWSIATAHDPVPDPAGTRPRESLQPAVPCDRGENRR